MLKLLLPTVLFVGPFAVWSGLQTLLFTYWIILVTSAYEILGNVRFICYHVTKNTNFDVTNLPGEKYLLETSTWEEKNRCKEFSTWRNFCITDILPRWNFAIWMHPRNYICREFFQANYVTVRINFSCLIKLRCWNSYGMTFLSTCPKLQILKASREGSYKLEVTAVHLDIQRSVGTGFLLLVSITE